jgi:hypothetical protein
MNSVNLTKYFNYSNSFNLAQLTNSKELGSSRVVHTCEAIEEIFSVLLTPNVHFNIQKG